jgi:hypothetical protein
MFTARRRSEALVVWRAPDSLSEVALPETTREVPADSTPSSLHPAIATAANTNSHEACRAEGTALGVQISVKVCGSSLHTFTLAASAPSAPERPRPAPGELP